MYHSNTNCSAMPNLRPLMSCFVHQSLSSSTGHRDPGALRVIDAKLRASVHADIKLRQIARQMLMAHVLVHTDQTALEDRKETFKGVGMHIAPRKFILGMVHRLMVTGDAGVVLRTVSDKAGTVREGIPDSELDAHASAVQVHGADWAATLYEGKDDFAALGMEGAVAAGLFGAGQ